MPTVQNLYSYKLFNHTLHQTCMWISCFKVLYIIKLCAQAWFPFPELAIHCLDTSLNENKERNTITLHIKKLKEIPESNQGKITNDASIYWRGQRWVWKSQRYCLHTSRSQLILLPMGFFWVFNVFNSTLHHHHRCQDTEEEEKRYLLGEWCLSLQFHILRMFWWLIVAQHLSETLCWCSLSILTHRVSPWPKLPYNVAAAFCIHHCNTTLSLCLTPRLIHYSHLWV